MIGWTDWHSEKLKWWMRWDIWTSMMPLNLYLSKTVLIFHWIRSLAYSRLTVLQVPMQSRQGEKMNNLKSKKKILRDRLFKLNYNNSWYYQNCFWQLNLQSVHCYLEYLIIYILIHPSFWFPFLFLSLISIQAEMNVTIFYSLTERKAELQFYVSDDQVS